MEWWQGLLVVAGMLLLVSGVAVYGLTQLFRMYMPVEDDTEEQQ